MRRRGPDLNIADITPHVIVVGGGPSGCAAAMELSKHAVGVTLLEKSSPNRDKPCGDLFMPEAVKCLRRLGITLDDIKQLSGATFDRIDFYRNSRLLFTLPYPDGEIWTIPRRAIDQKLRETVAKRCTLIYGSNVLRIDQGRTTIEVEVAQGDRPRHVLKCDAAIIAAGTGNALSHSLGITGLPHFAPAVSGYVLASIAPAPAFDFVDEVPEGYCWRFPLGGGITNVGVCSRVPFKKSHLLKVAEGLAKRMGVVSSISWRFGCGALWSGDGVEWHNNIGAVACGDAAGVIDPTTTEGLSHALHTGETAAQFIASYLQGPLGANSLRRYSEAIHSHLSSRYDLSLFRRAWSELCHNFGTGHSATTSS